MTAAVSGCPEAREALDCFGSRTLYGCVQPPHSEFSVTVTGAVQTGLDIYEEYSADPMTAALFKAQTPLTAPGPALLAYRRELALTGGSYDKAIGIMAALHGGLTYAPGATTVRETAENALAQVQGVCQDYAHIMLSLLRLEGIPCRYAAGMTLGEGASHAWVEALCNGYWYGFDPTNGLLVDENYIRVSCGRDAGDCAVIRGTFRGLASQVQSEFVTVTHCDSSTSAASRR